MLWFRWIASVAMFACATGAAIAEEVEEREDTIECWDGSYLTGFTGHAGHVINRMSIVCARWNPDHGRLDKPVVTTRGLIGQSKGGDELDDVLCPRGWAVAGGYSYDYARHDGSEALHHFDFNCRPVGSDGGLQPYRFGSNSNAEIVFRPNHRRQCADGELAKGIKAYHGKYILQWQLICTRAPSVIIATKPPGPDAFRETMTSKRSGGGLIVGTAPPPPPPDSAPPPPPVRLTKTTGEVDVLEEPDGAKYGGVGDFLPAQQFFPVLVEQPGWCQLELKNFPFVVGGKGWVSSTFLESCGK